MIEDAVLRDDWHVVAYAPDLPEATPVPARLLGEEIVLWRLGERVHAWRDLCVHRGTRLSLGSVRAERLVCAYHGWTYDEDGRCVHFPAHPSQTPPAKARATVYHARVAYDWVWVSLGSPARDVPAYGEWGEASFRKVHCGPYEVRASGPRTVENFLDVTHFPFVHQGLLGDQRYPEVNDYDVEAEGDGLVARDITIWQPDPDGSGQPARVTYTYRVPRPLTAYFVKSSAGPRFAMFFTATPVERDVTRVWMSVALDYGDQTDQQIRDFEDQIMRQDIPIVESQRPELLPLDLQAELHLRSDRTALRYRRWLRELGVTFGTE
ncbi:MAG TPA: aromatic ring-hydroxylating dioxygenase subunit alpha [Ktedonobacterales bacterium]